MANDFIVVTRTNRPNLGAQVIRAANDLIELCDRVAALAAAASHMHDGATFTAVETNFGLPGSSGANFVTLLGYMDEIFNTNTDVTGANRLARLKEFAARLAGQ